MRYSKKFKNEAVRMYESGLSTCNVANKLGCVDTSVRRWVLESGAEMRNSQAHKRYSKKFKEDAIRMYASGLSTYEVADKLGCESSSVNRWVRDSDKKSRTGARKRKYLINENYFSKIDTAEKSYWVGFLLADGCLISREGRGEQVILRLMKTDAPHLEKFREALTLTHPIRYRENLVEINITNKKLYDDLFDLGLRPRKAWIAKPVAVPSTFKRDYFRGLLDGDGSIFYVKRYSKYGVDLTGTKKVVTDFSNWLGYDGRYVHKSSNGRSYSFRQNARQSVRNILRRLYYNAEVYLDRKYELYLEIEEQRTLLLFNFQ